MEFENKDDCKRACQFLTPLLKERKVVPRCDTANLTITYGLLSHAFEVWQKVATVELAKAFPAVPFRVTAWDDMANFWWGYNKDGEIKLVDHYEETLEMLFRWHIDVDDPFAGPNEENWAELKRCREQDVHYDPPPCDSDELPF